VTTPSQPVNRTGRQLAQSKNKAIALQHLQRQQAAAAPEPTIWDIPAPPAWEDLHLDQQDAIRERFKLAALAMAVRLIADERHQSPAALLADWEVG